MPDTPENIVPITKHAQRAAEEFTAEHNREFATILFTDLVDSTKLQADLGNVEAARLAELHRKIVRDELAKYDAREIEWAGDSCLALFSTPSDAVVFALRMQGEHRRIRETEPRVPLVRVGMHLGEIIVKRRTEGGKKTEDLFGLQVSEAARVMSVARGDQIFCTRAVFDNARSTLKGRPIEGVGDTVWVNYGAYLLKGSQDPVELCEIGSAEVDVMKAPKTSDKIAPVMPGGVDAMRALIPYEAPAPPSRGRLHMLFGILTGLLLGAAIGLALFPNALTEPQDAIAVTPSVKRFELDIGPTIPLDLQQVSAEVAMAPDGRHLAYTAIADGTKRLYVRDLTRIQSVALSDTENAWAPFFSPDGQWIGFYAPGVAGSRLMRLMKVSVDGGQPKEICDTFPPAGATWLDDGSIVFTGQDDELPLNINPTLSHLFRVNASGGTPVRLTKADGARADEWTHAYPSVIYGTQALLFVIARSNSRKDIAVLRLDSETHQVVVKNGTSPQYAASGHIIFQRGEALWAVQFDPETLEVTGDETRVESGVQTNSKIMPRVYGISKTGALVYAPVEPPKETRRKLVWVDHAGVESDLGLDAAAYYLPRVSADGKRVAVTIEDSDNSDIWIHEVDRPYSLNRFTDTQDFDGHAHWLPGGNHIVYGAYFEGVFSMFIAPVNRTRPPALLYRDGAPTFVTPSGRTILFAPAWNDEFGWDIGALDVSIEDPLSADESSVRRIARTRYSEGNPAISPDGNWIAYSSDESGRAQVYVQPYPNTDGGRWQISTEGGNNPLWSMDMKEIYFVHDDKMLAVTVGTEPNFAAGIPRQLFEQPYLKAEDGSRQYDLEYPEGKRFLMIKEIPDPETTKLVYVENWTQQLR